MPTRPRRIAGHQSRSLYWRSDGDMQVNEPQLVWLGSDQWPGVLGQNATAEALPVVTRATSLVAGPLTAAPFKVQSAGAGAALQTPRWLSDPMLLRPDARLVDGLQAFPSVQRLSRSEFWAGFIRSAVWWGMGCFVAQTFSDGSPVAGTMRLINPQLLSVENSRWVVGSGPDAARFDRDGYLDLGGLTYRIVVMRNPHSPVAEDGTAMGVFALSPGAFGLAGQVDSYASGTFKSGVPAGYLKINGQDLTQPQADALKAKWLAAHGGDSRSIAILNSSTDFTPISMSPVDAELAAVKRLAIGDVAFAFGLDPMTLGVSMGNSATYNNVRDAWENHRDFGLSPWIAGLQDTLSALLSGDRTVSVNLDGFANPPAGERYAAYKVAVDSGFLTKDEVRAMEGLPPLGEAPAPPAELPDPPADPTQGAQ